MVKSLKRSRKSRSKSRKPAKKSMRKSKRKSPVSRYKNTPCGQFKKINCGSVDPNCQWTRRGCKARKSTVSSASGVTDIYYGPAMKPV